MSSSSSAPEPQNATTSAIVVFMDQDKVVAPDITSSTTSTNRNEISCFKVTSAPMHVLLSSSHRGSISTPILSTSNNLETKTRYTIATPTTTANITTITTAGTTTTASAVVLPSLSRTTGTKRSTRDLISRTVGLNKSVGGNNKSMSQIDEVHHSSSPKASIASSVANEILSLIFRNLLDRKSILNCSLVSTHWHGPAKIELARIAQDMPFNGLGLVHAIR
ncbi:hypothetical protein BGZ49_010753 [Haplosporangium sp. Z 27]|nr:hypothetical protein BGZ49_010753 [Haplosporangium sp. Z 27]